MNTDIPGILELNDNYSFRFDTVSRFVEDWLVLDPFLNNVCFEIIKIHVRDKSLTLLIFFLFVYVIIIAFQEFFDIVSADLLIYANVI